jgi:hypothetical protein
LNQSKPRGSYSPEIDLIDLCSFRSYSKYLMTDRRQRRTIKGGSVEIRLSELMALWINDKKFLSGMRFLFRMLLFTMAENDDFEHSAQEQEEWCTMTIGFKFHRGLKSSVITFQAVVRQPPTTNPIDSPARPPIETPSMTIRSPGLIPGL